MIIDFSIYRKIKLREEFDMSEEEKTLYSLKNIRRKDKTPLTQMSDDVFYCDFRINKLNKKREKFSNDDFNIKRY